MKYYFEKTINYSFEVSIERVKEELKKEGFGILTKIDMQSTLKEKLGVDFRKYIILEACNPSFAYKSLQIEENIGILLPCNIVVQQKEAQTQVALINPEVAMQGINNPEMDNITLEISQKLKNVINNL